MPNPWIARALYSLAKRCYRCSMHLTFTVPWQVQGRTLHVPFLSGVGEQNLSVAEHDLALQRVINRTLAVRSGGVVDIGCNIGHFMELCVMADGERPYVGFDPSVACCYYVERFIRENGLKHHRVLPVGLGAATGTFPLHNNGAFDVCASLSPEVYPRDRYGDCGTAVTLSGDEILPGLLPDGIALIKIDVEGFELEVLRGLDKVLDSERPYVLFEVLTSNLLGARAHGAAMQRRQRAEALEDFFLRRQYVLYGLRRDTSLVPAADLANREISDSVEFDHLALPREQAARFLEAYGLPFTATRDAVA